MVSALLDTSVIIDVLRGYHPAQAWLQDQAKLGITRLVWLEVLQGAANRQAEAQSVRLLKRFDIVPIEENDFIWAIEKMLKVHLSHDVGGTDALIAATSFRLQSPLYTRNLKHFQPLLGDLAHQPY